MRQHFSSADDKAYIKSEPSQNLWKYAGSSASGLDKGIACLAASTWEWGGALVLGSGFGFARLVCASPAGA